MSTDRSSSTSRQRRDIVLAASCGVFVALMVGASYAAVPFYDWFCRATGLNGTTQVSRSAPETVSERKLIVRFDANVAAGLAWRFAPEQTSIEVRVGQVVTVNYRATNQSSRDTIAVAGYNVAPLESGAYFQKINCFCFEEQRLGPGETRELPVVFYIDPSLLNDAESAELNTITLSYTMYPARERAKPIADGSRPASTTGSL